MQAATQAPLLSLRQQIVASKASGEQHKGFTEKGLSHPFSERPIEHLQIGCFGNAGRYAKRLRNHAEQELTRTMHAIEVMGVLWENLDLVAARQSQDTDIVLDRKRAASSNIDERRILS